MVGTGQIMKRPMVKPINRNKETQTRIAAHTEELAINTETPEEFKLVSDMLPAEWKNPDTRWSHYGKNTIILSHTHGFASIAWAKSHGYQIVKASDWLNRGKVRPVHEDNRGDSIVRSDSESQWRMALVFIMMFFGCVALAVFINHIIPFYK